MNVVGYVRVSHEEQVKHGFSLAAQREALQKWADDNGHSIIDWYVDEGVSARKKVKNRPQLQKMLADIPEKKIDLIIFIKLDRYFRSVAEYHETQKILEQHRVDWKAILEDYDTTTTDGRFRINIMLSISEQEADRTSDRIKFAFEHKIRKKQPVSGSQPFGYKIGVAEDGTKCVVKDEDHAEYVNIIFAHFLRYQSVSATTKHMMSEHGIKIRYDSIKKMLRNTYYHGHYHGVDDYCPSYISKETYDKIQDILDNRHIKTPQTKRVYLFSGLLRCPCCGNNLSGNFLRKTEKNGDYLSYRCVKNRKQKHCENNYCLPERKFEKWLIAHIRPELERYIAEIEIGTPKPVSKVNKAEIRDEMERLNIMFRKKRISEEEYDREYEALEAQLAEEQTEEVVDVESLKEYLNADIWELYEEISREDKRAAWREIIDHIVIDKNGNHTVIFSR